MTPITIPATHVRDGTPWTVTLDVMDEHVCSEMCRRQQKRFGYGKRHIHGLPTPSPALCVWGEARIVPPSPDYSTPQQVTARIREAARAWGRTAATNSVGPQPDQRASSAWYYGHMLPALETPTWGRTYRAFREACQWSIPTQGGDMP